MAGFLLFAAAVAGGALLIGIIRRYSGRKQRLLSGRLLRHAPPAALGVRPGHPAYEAVIRLEASLSPETEARVKDRVLKNRPAMQDREWDWIWFELKRFFLMSAVMRSVNMYSARMDEAWHEFLMFSREYQQFCERFCGAMIHHAPHTPRQDNRPDPEEHEKRAWFDWVYGELFEPNPVSGAIWGAFYRYPLPQALLGQFEFNSHESLKRKFFNAESAASNPDLLAVINELISRMKRQISEAKRHHERGERPGRVGFDPMDAGLLSGAMVYASMPGDPNVYGEYMREQQHQLNRQTGSICGTAASNGNDGNHGKNGNESNHGGSDGGDGGGGSSCSSGCSGGCSS